MAPLLPVALALIAGIVLSGLIGGAWWAVLPIVAGGLLMAFRHVYYALLSLCVAVGMLMHVAQRTVPPQEVTEGGKCVYSGVVKEHCEVDGAQSVIVLIDSCNERLCDPFMAKCFIPGVMPEAEETFRIRFQSALRPLSSRLDLPDEIDYNRRARLMGVMAEGYIPPDDIVALIPEKGWTNEVRRYRYGVQRLIVRLPVGEKTQRFLIAALTGDRALLDHSTRELYASTGIAHILALSGLHVGMLMGVIALMLSPLSVLGWRFKWMSRLLTVVLLWGFAVLTGMSPSVVRAVIMATVFMLTAQMERVWSPLNALSMAAIVIIVFDPLSVYSLGFQLSFAAVLAIILFAGRMNPFEPSDGLRWAFAGYITASIAAMAGTGIVSAFHFHVFPVYFLLTNVTTAVLLPIVVGGGVILAGAKHLGFEATWLAKIVDGAYGGVDSVAGWIGGLPGATIDDVWIEPLEVGLYVIVVALFALWLYRRRAALLIAAGIVTLFGVGWHFVFQPRFHEHEMYISRSSSETNLVVKEGKSLYLATTARGDRREREVLARDSARYRDYMLRRGIKTLNLLGSDTVTAKVERKDNVVKACGKTFVVVSSASHERHYGIRPDYLVVSKGFSGDIIRLVATIKPDSVLLSADLNLRRHDRYLSELLEAAIPHRSLRSVPFRIVGE